MTKEKLVLYFTPSLVATLLSREKAKGGPLTEEEVIAIRDSCQVIALSPEVVREMDKSRGYVDINADDCWNEWQRVRTDLNNEIQRDPANCSDGTPSSQIPS